MRDGEAIMEVMMRRGVRPDIVCWQNLMRVVVAQVRSAEEDVV